MPDNTGAAHRRDAKDDQRDEHFHERERIADSHGRQDRCRDLRQCNRIHAGISIGLRICAQPGTVSPARVAGFP